MKVSRFKVENFSSFVDSGWIELAPGLNVVVGQNNSGKSSLLQALNTTIPDKAHRDQNAYMPGSLKTPRTLLDIETTPSEFRSRLEAFNSPVRTTINGPTDADINALRSWLSEEGPFTLKCQSTGNKQLHFREPTFSDRLRQSANTIGQITLREGRLDFGHVGGGSDDTLIQAYTGGESPAFFNFSAQRLNVSRSPFGTEGRLASDASNLPAFLAYLFGNRRALYEEVEERLREVIPSVSGITVAPENGSFEILLWPDRTAPVRQLAFSLTDSGTGIAQAIAIIAAVVTTNSGLIVVDEINSFLHPSAVKKLLQICTTFYDHHQYVVSSHSADVIGFTGVERLIVVERDGFVSSAKSVSKGDLYGFKSAMGHLGVSMMDVLGSEYIVWVEGPTEEVAFPMVLTKSNIAIPEGVAFTAVASTGDFSRRGGSKKAVVNLYKAATQAVAPLMRGLSFALDRETLSDQAVEDIERQTDGRLKLLPRRCLECYALHSEAIAHVLNQELEGDEIRTIDVRAELLRLAPDRKYGAATKWKGSLTDVEWLKRVDAANLLADLFSTLSDNKLSFRKTIHTPKILAELKASELGELTDFVSGVMRTSTG